ncbi:MAG: hypothetical protein LIP05_13715 [Tannerellaceae bacterium]|nr:hypothetical protein [Tannerellaceae bacterium]
MRLNYILLCAVFLFLTGNPPAVIAQKKIRTMIATGQDGSHWWQGGSDAIKMILENSELFTVDILTTPDWDGDMNLFNPDFKKI